MLDEVTKTGTSWQEAKTIAQRVMWRSNGGKGLKKEDKVSTESTKLSKASNQKCQNEYVHKHWNIQILRYTI